MLFRQFVFPPLGHASYLVADEASGQALVLDPRRDIEPYLDATRAEGLRIVYALDTHGHNDYVSGLSELAARTGARLLGSAAGQLGYGHQPVRDGEVVELGDVAFRVLHTPGHTPEHVSLLVSDRSVSEEPALLLSGGALLVGDVARPDLLGDAGDVRKAAAAMEETLRSKILALPDHVEVFPTHVAGSLCGGNIGSRLSTTVGYERRTNPLLVRLSEADAAPGQGVPTDQLPAVPPYWRRMRTQNLAGAARVGVLPEPAAMGPEAFADTMARGAVVLDVRQPEAFAGGHIRGALSVGFGNSFPVWAGTLLPADTDVLLVLDQPWQLPEVRTQLLLIGYEPPVGWLAPGMAGWRTSGGQIETLQQVSVHALRDRMAAGELRVVDVRQPAEWADGHIDGAHFLTGAQVPERVGDLPCGGQLAVVCGSGFRSTAVASFLAAAKIAPVLNVVGGMAAWSAAGYPVSR